MRWVHHGEQHLFDAPLADHAVNHEADHGHDIPCRDRSPGDYSCDNDCADRIGVPPDAQCSSRPL